MTTDVHALPFRLLPDRRGLRDRMLFTCALPLLLVWLLMMKANIFLFYFQRTSRSAQCQSLHTSVILPDRSSPRA